MANQPRARLLALVALLAAVVVGAFYVRRPNSGAGLERASLRQTKLAEPAFQTGATAGELLELAERTADELIEEFPDDPGAHSVQARRHYSLSETEQARALWRKSLTLDPEFAEAFFGLGLLALDSDRHEEAAERFEEVARLGGEDPRVPVLLAKSWLLAGRTEAAILILEQHVTTEQTSAEAWELTGQAYLQAQQFDRAAQSFQMAVDALPDMKEAVYGLSRAYAGLGDSQKASFYAERFRQLAEADHARTRGDAKAFSERNFAAHIAAQTHVDAARIYLRRKNVPRAEDLLLRAVLLEPDNTQFLVQLQQSLQARDAHAQAAEVGERIVQLAPQELDQWLNLGWLYSNLNQPERAIAACQQAIELSPEDPRCQQAHEIIQRLQ
ncbi:MAG: tetratricopeptide repeat protein [Pirellulaceae bacterium]